MQELGKSLTDQDVNTLAAQHFESQQVSEVYIMTFIPGEKKLPKPLSSAALGHPPCFLCLC